MNKTAIMGGVVILVLIAVVAAYLLMGSGSKYVPPNTTTTQGSSGSSTVPPATTTASSGGSTTTPRNSSQSYTINVENKTGIGEYLTNASGFTLYIYTSDVANSSASACNGGCASAWPPFYTSRIVIPQVLDSSGFGTITRSGGAKQTTYDGYPLYFYAGDSNAGQTNGQNVGGFKVATAPTLTTH